MESKRRTEVLPGLRDTKEDKGVLRPISLPKTAACTVEEPQGPKPTTSREKEMKNVLFLMIVLFIFGCKNDGAGQTSAEEDMAIQNIQEGSLTIYNVKKYNSIVVKIPEITSYLYQRKIQKTIAEIASDSSYSLLANASFFDYDFPSRSFSHAGYLKIHNQVLASMRHDNQITRLFAYDSKNKTVSYFDTVDLDRTRDFDLVVQTGPQIIDRGTICNASIESSTNGNRATFRTAFGSVNGREFYIIVTRQEFTLKDLGGMLLRSGIFTGVLDVVDFDGGPSTALYVRNHPEMCFNPTSGLPMLLGVR
jgi:hypothetical protein